MEWHLPSQAVVQAMCTLISFSPGEAGMGSCYPFNKLKACGGWEMKSPSESQLSAVRSMTAESTIPGSVTWSLKNRTTDSATKAPSHPAFSVALGPTAAQAVKKS